MVALNSPAPDFVLPGLDGLPFRLRESRGQILVLNFWSLQCPWSRHTDDALREWPEDLASAARVLRIACSAEETQEEIRAEAGGRELGTVLLDSDRLVTDLYTAMATPHFFLIDRGGILRYRGAFDNTTFRNRNASRHYLEDAVRAVRDGKAPDPAETPAYGCAIVRW